MKAARFDYPFRLILFLFACVLLIHSGDVRARESDVPATAPSAAQTFGAFSVLGSTDSGQTLFMKLPAGQTLETAITQTADELGKVFDAKPALSGAFANAQSKSTGGAILDAKRSGKDIHGLIFCGTAASGGSATVIIASPNASKEELATLFSFIPAQLKMATHKFPDGSGSIDLPDGWTTSNTSATHGIVVIGPAGQQISVSNIIPVNEPNCTIVRTALQTDQLTMQNYQTAMRNYQQQLAVHKRYPNTLMPREPQKPATPEPDPNIRFPAFKFCPYCDGPEQVLKTWYPIMEKLQKHNGKGYSSLEKVIEVFPGPPNPFITGSKSGTAYIAVDDHLIDGHGGDKVTHLRVLALIGTAPVSPGEVWQLSFSVMRAPDATFDHDLPVMRAIMNSVNLDMNVVTGQINAEGAAARKMGEQMHEQIMKNGRDFQDEQARSFNAHEVQIAAQEKARHDSNSDFIEYIGGVRDVYDTQTGQMHSVDLFHSDAIVNGMNAAVNDPNRYVQIPLRYER